MQRPHVQGVEVHGVGYGDGVDPRADRDQVVAQLLLIH